MYLRVRQLTISAISAFTKYFVDTLFSWQVLITNHNPRYSVKGQIQQKKIFLKESAKKKKKKKNRMPYLKKHVI